MVRLAVSAATERRAASGWLARWTRSRERTRFLEAMVQPGRMRRVGLAARALRQGGLPGRSSCLQLWPHLGQAHRRSARGWGLGSLRPTDAPGCRVAGRRGGTARFLSPAGATTSINLVGIGVRENIPLEVLRVYDPEVMRNTPANLIAQTEHDAEIDRFHLALTSIFLRRPF